MKGGCQSDDIAYFGIEFDWSCLLPNVIAARIGGGVTWAIVSGKVGNPFQQQIVKLSTATVEENIFGIPTAE